MKQMKNIIASMLTATAIGTTALATPTAKTIGTTGNKATTEASAPMEVMCGRHIYSQPNVRMMQRFRVVPADAKVVVENLPEGLTYNAKRQRIEGRMTREGVYHFTIVATKGKQQVKHPIRLEVSSKLASPTPFMGWMTWNSFEGDINEENLRAMADAMVKSGLKEAGYKYLCIDDLWHGPSRKKNGHLGYDTEKFPNGLKALTDYVHSLGLKIGIYSDAAELTCAGAPGSLGYEQQDARQYAQWGFDFLKYDYCYAPAVKDSAIARYTRMGNALKATNRTFYYDVCEWGQLQPWKWAAEAGGHSWRITYDSRDIWNHFDKHDGSHCGVVQAIDIAKGKEFYAGPNRFNDMDMMMTGLYGKGKSSSHNRANGMTDREYQAQFTMWSILASPLVPVLDLRTMNEATRNILTNKEVIAINQDPMGQQAECIYSKAGLEVFAKELENGDVAVAMLNRTENKSSIGITLKELYLKGTYVVRDLWQHRDIATTNNKLSAEVESHEARIFRLRKK